jgi:hypothetical protein
MNFVHMHYAHEQKISAHMKVFYVNAQSKIKIYKKSKQKISAHMKVFYANAQRKIKIYKIGKVTLKNADYPLKFI